jgi:hypothetical protein
MPRPALGAAGQRDERRLQAECLVPERAKSTFDLSGGPLKKVGQGFTSSVVAVSDATQVGCRSVPVGDRFFVLLDLLTIGSSYQTVFRQPYYFRREHKGPAPVMIVGVLGKAWSLSPNVSVEFGASSAVRRRDRADTVYFSAQGQSATASRSIRSRVSSRA